MLPTWSLLEALVAVVVVGTGGVEGGVVEVVVEEVVMGDFVVVEEGVVLEEGEVGVLVEEAVDSLTSLLVMEIGHVLTKRM